MDMLKSMSGTRRLLPSIDRLINHVVFGQVQQEFGRELVIDEVRLMLDELRAAIAQETIIEVPGESALAAECSRRLHELARPSLRRVHNLTGTVLHTNLGRALYPSDAVAAATVAMRHSVNLEYDIESGGRGERDAHVEKWLLKFTGAQAAIVVNNNAAAVYLVLNSLAARKEVVVSRGELVEIGGAFRIPDIMARAGCRLREVGTTNRTHRHDFAQAIDPRRTAAVMKVHASNYVMTGFTSAVPEWEMASVAHENGLILINDLGSGSLVNLEDFGLPHEPTPREALANGSDVVTFSGDKLLGGPQCGLIVGRKDLIEKIRKNPMKRALRVDKVRLAALEAVLRLYAHPERLAKELPALRLLGRPQSDIRALAERILPAVAAALGIRFSATVVDCLSQIGSGAMPVDTLPSAGIALAPPAGMRKNKAAALAQAFRALPVPVLGRIQDGTFILDLRCLEDEQEFVAQLAQLDLTEQCG